MGRLKKMKSIKILSLIMFFLSIISCALRTIKSKNKIRRRNKSKSKTSNFDGSELDVMTRIISQRMCKKVGKRATYNFFNNIDNFINGKLDDDALYVEIFGDTFSEAKRMGTIDFNKIQTQMLYSMMQAYGGNGQHTQPPVYWDLYSEDMQRQNGEYLNGLAKAASAKSAFYRATARVKEVKGNVDNAQQVAELGANVFNDGPKKAFADYIEGGATNVISPASGMKWLQKIAITITQTHIMHQANSAIFNSEGLRQADANFKRGLLDSRDGNGNCGRQLPAAEEGNADYANAPYFTGNHNALND